MTPSQPDPGQLPGERRMRYFWVWAGVWLVYMVEPIKDAWHQPQLWQRVTGITTATTFAAVYLASFMLLRERMHRTGNRFGLPIAWGVVLLMAALDAVLMLAVGESAIGVMVYVAVIAVFMLPTPAAWPVVGALSVLSLVLTRVVPGWKHNDDLALQILIGGLAVWGVGRVILRNAQLAAAREEIAQLAVANERNRFARDLHDLLGHSLTVVSVKAELAGRLIRMAPERAEEELADIQRLAREALTDVRSAVGGYREVSLGAELARGRSALTAAAIEAELPYAVDAIPPDRQELFGWAVREGITNVVRHSGAKRCWVTVTPSEVSISDDGIGPSTAAGLDPGSAPAEAVGHGLAGLRERVAAAGGTLSVARRPEGGFVLRVSVP